jgi:hypothetical protein
LTQVIQGLKESSKMDSNKLIAWLDEVHADTADYGWEIEHMDALVRIGEHTIKLGLAGDGAELLDKMEMVTDYMEQWGADSDPAEVLMAVIRKYLV